MHSNRLWLALPYAVVIGAAAWFYKLAGGIHYVHQGSNLGPDFWPRVVLAALMIICAAQGVRLLLFGHAEDKGLIGAQLEEAGDSRGEAPRSPALLAAGMGLIVAYGALVTILGFLISTTLFMALFMYAGRYRAHRTIWLSSLIGAAVLVVVFQKVVYVSLPRGMPPFDRVADMLLALL